MLTIKHKAIGRTGPIESLATRKARQKLEGSEAMRDYLRAQQAARERMAALREERLKREAQAKGAAE